MDLKLEKVQQTLINEIKKSRRNFQFDLNHNLKQMAALIVNNSYGQIEINKRMDINKILQQTFPIKEDEKFLKFEESLHIYVYLTYFIL